MNWPWSKKEERQKKERDDRYIFREEPAEQKRRFAYFFELPLYIKIFIIIAIIFALNAALFLPLGITAILFELWLGFLQFVKLQIPLWMVFIMGAVLLAIGTYLIPRIDIPSLEERYIYLSQWKDGNLRYFNTLKGTLVFKDAWVKNIAWFRWVAIGNVEVETTDERSRITAFESRDLEVSKDIAIEQENRHLKRIIAQMERDQRRGKTAITIEELGKFVEQTKERK